MSCKICGQPADSLKYIVAGYSEQLACSSCVELMQNYCGTCKGTCRIEF